MRLVIIGSGGFAAEVIWLVECLQDAGHAIDLLGLISKEEGKLLRGVSVLGDDEWMMQELDRNTRFVVAIGDASIRAKAANKLENVGFQAATLIHPSVQYSDTVKIGQGSILCAGAVLTTHIQLGRHNLINLHATLGHDAVLADFVTVSPGVNVSGGVRIGERVDLGSGSVVLPNIEIAADVQLGAGAVATKNISEAGKYIGVPARKFL